MEGKRLWNKEYITLMFVSIFACSSFYMIMTMLLSHLTSDRVGFTTSFAGFVVGMFSIVSLVCRPICGIMADRLNKVVLMRASAGFAVFAIIGYGLFTDPALVILVRILHALSSAVASTVLVTLVTQYVPKDKLGEGIGYYGLTSVLASAVAPGLGVTIADRFGNSVVFYIAAIMAVLMFLMLCLFPTDKQEKKTVSRKISLDEIITFKVLGYTVVSGAFAFANGIISSYLLTYAQSVGIASIGVYYLVNAIALFLIRPVAGKLMDKKGLSVVALPAYPIGAISMFMLAAACLFPQYALGIILISSVLRAIGQGAAQPSLQTACIQKAGMERSGAATSTYMLGADIGQGIGPMIAGVIVERSVSAVAGYQTVFTLCGVLLVVAFAGLIAIQCRNKKKTEEV